MNFEQWAKEYQDGFLNEYGNAYKKVAYDAWKAAIKTYKQSIAKKYKLNFEIWHNLPDETKLNYLEFMQYHDKWDKGQSYITWRGQYITKAQHGWLKRNITG